MNNPRERGVKRLNKSIIIVMGTYPLPSSRGLLYLGEHQEMNYIELLYSKEEIVKSFIEDVEAVKDLLPKNKVK